MVILTLKAKNDHLQKLAGTRDYVKALAEFVWNAVDADATEVSVSFGKTPLGGLGSIVIKDNGTGFSKVRADHDFECLGDSWKLKVALTPNCKRSMHGKLGQGRLKFYSLADTARWTTVYKEKEKLFKLTVEIAANSLADSVVSDPETAPPGSETGTIVDLAPLKDTFDWLVSEEATMDFSSIFAPYILQYPDVKIRYNDIFVDPNVTIERSELVEFKKIVCPGRVIENLGMRIVEWKKKNESRKIYFGGEAGVMLGSLPANIQAPGFDFSVYAYHPFFQEIAKANLLEFDGLTDPDFAKVLEQIRDSSGDYFRARQAEKSGELIQDLKDAGVYPYEGDPKDDVERRQRQVFDIATHAVSSYSREFKKADNALKKMTLGLLREAIGNNPESVVRILRAVFNLPKARQDDFSGLLEKTELSNIISASSMIANRIVALKVLREIVFEPKHRQTIRERGELDVLVRDNTWMFGENFHISMPEAGLTKIMHRVSDELALKRAKGAKVRKPDGKIGRIDAFMGRVVPSSSAAQREFLMLELKRPSLTVGRKEIDQLEDYVNTILGQPDFVNTSNTWSFYLVTGEYDNMVKGRVTQKDRPVGLFLEGSNYTVWVKSWAEIIRDCETRLQFVQKELNLQVSDDEIENRIIQLKSTIIKADKVESLRRASMKPIQNDDHSLHAPM